MPQLAKHLPEIGQGPERDARLAELHAAADHGIEHPARNRPDVAAVILKMGDGTIDPLLDVLHAAASSEQRMPLVVNDGRFADMGRMAVASWARPSRNRRSSP